MIAWTEAKSPIENGIGRTISNEVEVTLLKARIAELELELADHEVLLASVNEALVIADPSGRIVFMDVAALSLHQFSSLEEARRVQPLLPELFEVRASDGRLVSAAEWPLARALRGEVLPYTELRVRNRRTGRAWAGSYSAAPMRDRDGRVVLVAVAIRNIMDEWTVARPSSEGERPAGQEGSLRTEVETRATQRLESIGVMAGGIAHDFNILLSSILADAELALANLDSNNTPREEIQSIRIAALRGAEIVRELMIYSGQEKGILDLVELSSLVEEILQLLKVSISKRAILRTDLAKNLPAVTASTAQIRQVVMNLVINASEAIGEPGGVIHVTTEELCLAEGQFVRLQVSDTGCGMTEETQARIFDPLFTTKADGRGLGLSVVNGIVRRHGGIIHLTSVPGEGTTFQVLLPCVCNLRSQNPASRDHAASTQVTSAGFVKDSR